MKMRTPKGVLPVWSLAAAVIVIAASTFQSFVAAAAAPNADGSCPGGRTTPDGQCLADYEDDVWGDSGDDSSSSSDDGPPLYPYDSDDDDSEDSSDDDYTYTDGRPNPHAHRDEMTDPEDNQASCERYLDLNGHRTYRESRSFYQEVSWSERLDPSKKNKNAVDVCMSLDSIVQICSSYRPHYHEPFVHFPAAYLREFRRVAFVGGGDSMLLHECLKYPDAELVLGLELDQNVVRESLRHFRTRPHFEDRRVQWWFGDAAKSLSLLPREWFGTFDLVMVDLSETGMSISVNDDLDIFGALALLLKPEGIMVKNEDYFSQMSKYFDYSISVYMDANPVLCDQDWAMGSNGADFLRPKLAGGLFEENKVEALKYAPLEDEDQHYRMIIDYSRNDAREQGQCDEYDAEKEKEGGDKKEPTKPAKSSGILLVVDADNATKDLELGSFEDALKAMGMAPLESLSNEGEDGASSLFVGMEEGYVSARTYPAGKTSSTVGLEILLWSKLNKQDDVMQALLDVVGVDEKSYSSYRVIHGGMNGYKNWEEELDSIGPVKKNVRQCDTEEDAKGKDDPASLSPTEAFNAVMTESLSQLFPKKYEKAVAVLCGKKGVDECATLDALKQNDKVHKVVAIWSCPDDGMGAGEDDGDEAHVYACKEENIVHSAKSEEGYSGLVVDPSAPDSLVEIGLQVFCSDRILRVESHPLLRDQVTFVTPLSSDAQTNIFARCLRRISKSLNRSGTIVVGKTAPVGVIASDSDGFVRKLVVVAENVETKVGVTTKIDKMRAGQVPFQENFDPVYHSANAYNQLEGLVQYSNQVPLASQSIYQLEEVHPDVMKKLSRSFAKEVLEDAIKGSPRFAKSGLAYFEVGDGSVAIALAATGHIVVTWNGAGVITMNILTVGEEKYAKVYQGEDPEMVLLVHKDIVDTFSKKLPVSTKVAAREQMPRGSNRVVNFEHDMDASNGCADHYELCKDFAQDGRCDSKKEKPWMHKYCSLSCGTCEEMTKTEE